MVMDDEVLEDGRGQREGTKGTAPTFFGRVKSPKPKHSALDSPG